MHTDDFHPNCHVSAGRKSQLASLHDEQVIMEGQDKARSTTTVLMDIQQSLRLICVLSLELQQLTYGKLRKLLSNSFDN